MGFVAEVAYEPLHIGDRHSKGSSSLGNHIFLDHDAAEIVGSELKCELADFQALGNPGALNILEVIEVNAAQCLGPKIFIRSHWLRLQARIFGLKRPADKRGKSTRF